MVRVLGLAIALSILLAAGAKAAEPKATTSELPAALKAMNPDQGRILSSAEAQKIRGQGGNSYGHFKHGRFVSAFQQNFLGIALQGGGNVNVVGKNRIGSHNHHFTIIVNH